MLEIDAPTRDVILAHAISEYPLEACGLLVGTGSRVHAAFPARNEAASARRFVAAPRDVWRAMREAEAAGLAVIGVYHSHTNSEAYPSRTDVRQAPDPSWCYLVISLARELAELRAFRIQGQAITEIPVGLPSAAPEGAP
jgi:proteasome lid subunit RPN8/RPN11